MSNMQRLSDPHSSEAGFTLIEMLVASLLMVFILVALATVTAQWLPNWNYGILRVERGERFAFGLNRVIQDLSVAEFVPADSLVKTPYFDGDELAVTFVRTAVGPNTHPGLEIVRFHEVGDSNGPSLVRDRAMFAPMAPGTSVRFVDPVVLIRPPYRVMFAYAGANGVWQVAWHAAAQLPTRVRITVRDSGTQQKLAVSTAALLHIDTPAECVSMQSIEQCLAQIAQGSTASNQASPAVEQR
jgi:general secretion pathway protein J